MAATTIHPLTMVEINIITNQGCIAAALGKDPQTGVLSQPYQHAHHGWCGRRFDLTCRWLRHNQTPKRGTIGKCYV